MRTLVDRLLPGPTGEIRILAAQIGIILPICPPPGGNNSVNVSDYQTWANVEQSLAHYGNALRESDMQLTLRSD